MVEVKDGFIHEAAHQLAPRQLQQGSRRQRGERQALVRRYGAAEERHRFVEDAARLPLPSPATPREPRAQIEARELVAFADREENAARLSEALLRRGKIAALGGHETQEPERAAFL